MAGELATPHLAGATALVMVDDRAPVSARPRGSTLTYPALAFALNALYACEHGYDLLYYRMGSAECSHQTEGIRRTSYCKLPAIAHTLRLGYSAVVFIDSDSWIRVDEPQFHNMTVIDMVRTYAVPPITPSRSADATAAPSAWFACDLPQLGDRPNGGFHIWRNSLDALATLSTWWHAPAGRYAVEHDYEQHVLQWHVAHLGSLEYVRAMQSAQPVRRNGPIDSGQLPLLRGPSPVSTLQLKAMDDEFRHAVAHVDHTKARRRLGVFSAALIRAALLQSTSPSYMSAVRGGATRLLSLPTDRERRTLKRLLSLADGAFPEAPAPAVVRRLLQHVAKLLRHSAQSIYDGMQQSVANLGLGTTRDMAIGATCGIAGARLRQIEYNATLMAQNVFPLNGPALPPVGTPISLRECVNYAAGLGDGNTRSIVDEAGRKAVLQVWVMRRDGKLALLSHPELCVHVGPGKAPKTPHTMLAQLGACNSPAVDSMALSTIAFLHPHELTSTSTDSKLAKGDFIMQTNSTIASVAGALANTARDINWPSSHNAGESGSSATTRNLEERYGAKRTPKKLGRRRQASTRDSIPRGKLPLIQDGLMGPDAVLPDSSHHNLCLGAWRGKAVIGAPLVWSRCRIVDGIARQPEGGKNTPMPLKWSLIAAYSIEAAGAQQLRAAIPGNRKLCLSADLTGWLT